MAAFYLPHGTTRSPSEQYGVTLIELMVAVVAGLLVMLAMTSLFSGDAARQRRATADADQLQNNMIGLSIISSYLKSAGGGVASATQNVTATGVLPGAALGCQLTLAKGTFTVAPVSATTSVADGAVSDSMIVMSAGALSSAAGQIVAFDAQYEVEDASANPIVVFDVTGLRKGSTVLLANRLIPGGRCYLRTVDDVDTGDVAGKPNYRGRITLNKPIAGLPDVTADRMDLYSLGVAPTFVRFTVNTARSTLQVEDLNQNTPPQDLVAYVTNFQVQLGLDVNDDRAINNADTWINAPTSLANFVTPPLLGGPGLVAGQLGWHQLKAVRIGLTTRTPQQQAPDERPGGACNASAATALATLPAVAQVGVLPAMPSSGDYIRTADQRCYVYKTASSVQVLPNVLFNWPKWE